MSRTRCFLSLLTGNHMNIKPIIELTHKRGWLDTWRFPVILEQEFHPCEMTNFLSFMADLDMFRDECLKDRCIWLKEHAVRNRCDIEYHRKDTESNTGVIFYRITIAFARKSEAEEYQLRWS